MWLTPMAVDVCACPEGLNDDLHRSLVVPALLHVCVASGHLDNLLDDFLNDFGIWTGIQTPARPTLPAEGDNGSLGDADDFSDVGDEDGFAVRVSAAPHDALEPPPLQRRVWHALRAMHAFGHYRQELDAEDDRGNGELIIVILLLQLGPYGWPGFCFGGTLGLSGR